MLDRECLENLLGIETISISEALKKIDENSLRVLFVVDSKGRLLGSLSDGDIRRWLIKTGDLKAPVTMAMNSHPKYVYEQNETDAIELMDDNYITAVPVIDSKGYVVSVIDNKNKLKKRHNISKGLVNVPVVMMAGGKGTRLYPYTKILPKPLIPVGDKPIAELIIESFCEYGCSDYYLVVNHKRNMIKAYFGDLEADYNVHFIDEDVPLGTGGGISLLKGKVKATFILTNCDNLVEDDYSKIYEYHKEHGNMVTMICSLKNFTVPYGVVHLAKEGSIESMEEKPTFSFFTNTGCYIVEPEVIYEIPEGTNIGFPDIIEKLRSEGKKVGVYPISESSWLDMGEIDKLDKMREYLENKD